LRVRSFVVVVVVAYDAVIDFVGVIDESVVIIVIVFVVVVVVVVV
jgi:hypothetical protein